MSVTINEKLGGRILEVAASGKLTDQDYQHFIPEFDRLAAKYGKIRVLFEMSQFHGWDMKAAWDDFKVGLKHYHHIERIAMIGETKWQEWMAVFCKPFTKAEVRYFDHAAANQARAWLEQG